MSQQIINVGAAPNDGTGDPLRTAFQKTNSNFTELYNQGSIYPRTAVEIAAGVTPTNYNYPPYNVLRYGADPTGFADSTVAVQNCVNLNYQTYFPRGTYYISGPVIINDNVTYFNIFGDEGGGDNGYVTIVGAINGNHGSYIASSDVVATDLTYPTATNPGPLKCCFYISSKNGIYFPRISNIRFYYYRFAIAFASLNGGVDAPIFTNLSALVCNALVMFYGGAQAPAYYECSGYEAMHISSATCYPADSPYAYKDNYGTDSLFIKNEYLSNNGGNLNPVFDLWFANSIVRPSTLSYVVSWAGQYYQDKDGVIYPPDSPVCGPSSWTSAFLPMRNGRTCFSPRFPSLFSYTPPGNNNAGQVLINGVVRGMEVGDVSYEDPQYPNEIKKAIYVVGSIQTAVFNNFSSFSSDGTPGSIPILAITGRGFSSGTSFIDTSTTTFLNALVQKGYTSTAYPALPVYWDVNAGTVTQLAIMNQAGSNLIAGMQVVVPSYSPTKVNGYDIGQYPQPSTIPSSGFPIIAWINQYFSPTGQYTSDGKAISAWNFSAVSPVKLSNGLYYSNYVLGRSIGYAGMLRISILNTTTNETDYGEFYIVTEGAYNYTTSQTVNNGDLYIYLSGAPFLQYTRFMPFTVGNTTVSYNSWDNINQRIILETPVTGLSAPLSAGSTITKQSYFINTITPFQRNFAAFVLYGQSPYFAGVAGDMAIVSQVCNSIYQGGPNTTLQPTDQSLCIYVTYANVAMPPTKYVSAVPTSGKWATGAIVYNTAPTAGGTVGWVCVAGGSPGTWKSFGTIAS